MFITSFLALATVLVPPLHAGEKVPVRFRLQLEKMQYKIREAEMQKIPYMLILGQEEKDGNKVSVRRRVYNAGKAQEFKLAFDSTFVSIN